MVVLDSDSVRCIQVLEHLTEMPDVYVAVISGRSISNVKAMVGISGITYAGQSDRYLHHPSLSTPVECGLLGDIFMLKFFA